MNKIMFIILGVIVIGVLSCIGTLLIKEVINDIYKD